MNTSEEQYFFDLAIKVIANRATDKERREFEALLTESAEHRERFEVFKADLVVAKDIVSLIDAADAKGDGLNEKQLARLQKDVDRVTTQTKGRKSKNKFYLILIMLGLLLAVIVTIFNFSFRNRTETLTPDDISTPDGIIAITINKLNSR